MTKIKNFLKEHKEQIKNEYLIVVTATAIGELVGLGAYYAIIKENGLEEYFGMKK